MATVEEQARADLIEKRRLERDLLETLKAFNEECDECFSVEKSPVEAIAALQEAIKYIEENSRMNQNDT